jgi:hypothetical protein
MKILLPAGAPKKNVKMHATEGKPTIQKPLIKRKIQ